MKAEDCVRNFTTILYTVTFRAVPRKIKQTSAALKACSIKRADYIIIRSTQIMPNCECFHIKPNYNAFLECPPTSNFKTVSKA